LADKLKFIDLKTFKEKALAEEEVQGFGLRKQFVLEEVKQVEGEDDTLQFTISTGSVDRDSDTINPDGWKLENYLKNPVVLWAHDYQGLPVAKAPATWVENGKLKSRAQFTPKDLYPFGHLVYQLYKQGYLKATSVGFNPLKWQFNEERKFGIDFLEQELLEYSCVPVPANPEALIDAKAKGIDLVPLKEWAERVLDEWHQEKGLWLPRSKVEQVFALLDGKKSFLVPDVTSKNDGDGVVEKGAISYARAHPDGTPKAPEDEEWDGPAEVAAADVDDLKVMCAWVDSENADKKGAYKLPHHKASGQHAVVWRGVDAAGKAVMGARGGVDIPEDDVAGVKAHLAKHYKEFNKTPPWETEEGRAYEAICKLNISQAIKEDIGRVLLPGVFDDQKSGRVLSRANEDRIRRAAELLQEVLAQLEEEPEQDNPDSVSHKNGDDVVLLLANDEGAGEGESRFDVDDKSLQEMVKEVLREALRSITGRVD
jgi:HK97 family phage prohead protease